MEIKTVKISELRPHPKNPRVHPDSAIEKLVMSIKEFGWTNPILASADGFILAGHARLKAAKKAGMEEVPVIFLPLEGAKAEAYMIADNRLQEDTLWDEELLAGLLTELEETGVDLLLTGFDSEEVDDMLFDIENEQGFEDDFDIDEALKETESTISQRGDVWLLGNHRVLCGDATVGADIEKLMDGRKANMVFTDPPYNVNYGEKASMLNEYNKGHRNTNKIKNDNMKSDAFLQFLIDSFKNMNMALSPGGAFYICHAEITGLEFRKAVLDTGLLLKQTIIWAKNSLVLGRQDYQWQHEPILYGWKPGAAHRWYGGRKQTTILEDWADVVVEEQEDGVVLSFALGLSNLVIKVPRYEVLYQGDGNLSTIWRFDKPLSNADHPTMKPVGIPARAIKNSSQIGDIVLDSFGGSGSTLIAAEQLKRSCYMMELDEQYADVIINRYIKYKGSSDDVYLVRNGEKLHYSEVVVERE